MSVRLVPPVRDPCGQQPRAARLSPEQVAGLLRIMRYVPDEEDASLEPFEVADALEVLDVERGDGGVTEEDHAEMRRRFAEEQLLQKRGFEPAPDDGGELWVRREEGMLKLYTRPEALQEAKKDPS